MSISTNTSDEIKQQSLSSINKVPLIGNIFKIKPEHHSRIFDFEQPIPDNLRDRHSDGSARNIGDKYVVVGEKTEEIEDDDNISRINYGCIEPDFAKSLIGTTDYMESVLKTRPTFWDQQIESGKFSVLFRFTFPAVLAERLVKMYTLENSLKFLRTKFFTSIC